MTGVLEGLSQTWLTIQGTLLPSLKEDGIDTDPNANLKSSN